MEAMKVDWDRELAEHVKVCDECGAREAVVVENGRPLCWACE